MLREVEFLSYRKALSQALVDIGEVDEDVVVLDADVARSTGAIRFAEKFPKRYFNLGISEQDLISTAAGIAVAGKKPVAIAFSMFLMRGWEQIRNCIGRDCLNVKLVGTHAGLSAHLDGSSHQCLEDISALKPIPNMAILCPADASATYTLTIKSVEEHYGPSYIRLGRDNALRVYDWGEELEIGRSKVLIEGHDATILAHGPMVGVCLEASQLLRKSGLSVGVVDFYTIKPVDVKTILKYAKSTGLLITVEEHNVIGGLGSTVSDVVCENYPVPTFKIGIVDSYGTSAKSYLDLLTHYKLTPQHVAGRIEGIVNTIKTGR